MKKALPFIATALFALLSYLGYSPDLAAADEVAEKIQQASDAVSMRNWLALGNVLLLLGIYIYDYVTDKKN